MDTDRFYSYSPEGGMLYHATKTEAQECAAEAIRSLLHHGISIFDLDQVTWGEVMERAVNTGAGYALKNALRLAHETEHPQVIDGRMRNGSDDLVLLKNIHETDLLFHDMVLGIAVIWQSLSGKIQRFKQYNFEDVTTVLDLLFEKYGVKRGGEEGNMQFFTFDRRFKLCIAIQKQIVFGPELQVAERKLRECLEQMTGVETSDLKTIVTAAFKLVDGKLRVSEVLRLRSYKISNPLWNEAMQIIDDAIQVISKKKQIRLYEHNDRGEYLAIPLDIAAL